MAKLVTVYWRDIPAQIVAKKGRLTHRVRLSQRFHDAIDRAAMRAGRGGSQEYLQQWRRVHQTCGNDLETEANARATVVEKRYSDELLNSLIKSGGTSDPLT